MVKNKPKITHQWTYCEISILTELFELLPAHSPFLGISQEIGQAN